MIRMERPSHFWGKMSDCWNYRGTNPIDSKLLTMVILNTVYVTLKEKTLPMVVYFNGIRGTSDGFDRIRAVWMNAEGNTDQVVNPQHMI